MDEYRHGFNKLEKAENPPLERAFNAARRGLQHGPNDAFVHRRMAAVLGMRGDLVGAQAAIEKALELNPNDADVVAHMGWILKQFGRWEEAMDSAQKARNLNPGHPPWYLETPALYYYYKKDCQNAYRMADFYHSSSQETAFREVLLIVAGVLCEKGNLSKHVERLNTKYPSFLRQPRKLLQDYGVNDELYMMILAHLKEAGVKFAVAS